MDLSIPHSWINIRSPILLASVFILIMTCKVYLADSKASVRKKLSLQHSSHDEAFSRFEVGPPSRVCDVNNIPQAICSHIYKFKSHFDLVTSWKDLDRRAVDDAEDLVVQSCQIEKLSLWETDTVMRDLIDWKLYQVHRAAQRKDDRQKKRLPTNQPSSSTNANPEVTTVRANLVPATTPRPGSVHESEV